MMRPERRRAERIRVNLPVRWEGFIARHEGTISDMSANGCFILTPGEVKEEELVSVEMNVPSMLHMQLWGIVVYTAQEIGFAIRFNELSATQQTLLARVLSHFRSRNVSPSNETNN